MSAGMMVWVIMACAGMGMSGSVALYTGNPLWACATALFLLANVGAFSRPR
jgi:hypothetical protein